MVTPSNRLAQNPGFYRELFVTCVTCFAYLMFGITRSFTAFALPQLLSRNYTSFHITENEGSWIACFIAVMNPIGSLIGGIMMDVIGRKLTLQMAFLPFVFCWCLIAIASNVIMIYVGVILLGLAIGMTFCSVTYIAEITTPQNRGLMMSVMDPAYVFGILLCNVLVNYVHWDTSAAIFSATSIVGFVLLNFVPESPLWLLSTRNPERALKKLSWLRKKPAHEVYPELEKLQIFMEDKFSKRSFLEYLRIIKSSWEPLRMLVVLSILQQTTGYTVMIGYTVLYFRELRLPSDPFINAIVYSFISFISSLFIPWAIGKLPRKALLAYSGAGMAVSMFIIAAYNEYFLDINPKPYEWIPLVCSYLYVVSSNYGVFPLPFIISGEIFPVHIRGVMQGVFGTICFTVIAVSMKIFPGVMRSLGLTNISLIFGAFSALTALYGKYVLPETIGKSLQDIRENYYCG